MELSQEKTCVVVVAAVYQKWYNAIILAFLVPDSILPWLFNSMDCVVIVPQIHAK